MSSPEPRRFAVARRVADPEVVQAVVGFITTMSVPELEASAKRGADMTERIQGSLGALAFAGPIAIRMMLGADRVETFARYDDADYMAILDGVCDSRPQHGAILRQNVPWFLGQMRRLRDVIVS